MSASTLALNKISSRSLNVSADRHMRCRGQGQGHQSISASYHSMHRIFSGLANRGRPAGRESVGLSGAHRTHNLLTSAQQQE
jgi:hypothetical protein